jgi:DNA-binding CsgD family transcriptional regulator
MQPRDQLAAKEIQVTTLVWEGLTNREIAKIVGTTEQVVKNYLRTAFDKLGVWSRLERRPLCGQPWGSRLGRATHFGDEIERLSERFGASSFGRTIAPRGSASQRGALPVVFSVAVLLNGTLSSGPIRNSSTEYSLWGPEGERAGRFCHGGHAPGARQLHKSDANCCIRRPLALRRCGPELLV